MMQRKRATDFSPGLVREKPGEKVLKRFTPRALDNAIAIAIVFVLGTVGLLLVASAARGDHADPFPHVEDNICIDSYFVSFPW